MLSKITKELTFFKQQPYNMQILLLTNMFYAFVLPVVEIFVGAYIMRNTNNPSYVALYQLAMYVGIVVASVINGELLKRFQVKHLYAFGILVSGLSMVVMMGLKTMGFGELFVAGLFMGIASGFFWANRYLLALNSTNDANRNYFFGLESFFFSVCSIIVPIGVGGFLTLNITGYQSSVIPALFMGFFAATLEKKLHKIIPDIVDMLLVPFLTLLISLLVGLFAVGPVLSAVEKGMTDLILMLLKLPFGIGGIAYGGLIQILCSVGMHHTVTSIIVSIFTETGVDYINPMGAAAIAGQLGAGLAVVMMQKNRQARVNMIPALIPALFGISEPVMYGLTFPRIKPFFMGCLGGAVGGGFAAVVGLCAKGTGVSMLPGMLLYLQGGMLQYLIVLALAVGVGFAGTWAVSRKAEK